MANPSTANPGEPLISIAPSLATAEALAVGVETLAGQQELLTNRLELSISPDAQATASSLDITSPVQAEAEALGLGLGNSRFTSSRSLNSPGLQRLIASGGAINGNANSEAMATGMANSSALARAVNVGLAGLDLIGRYDGVMRIGSDANPFSAGARASGLDLSGHYGQPMTLDAVATSRGYEGSRDRRNSLIGQIEANVAANALLSPLNPEAPSRGLGQADAVALENLELSTTSYGNGDGTASVIGKASANVGIDGPKPLSISDLAFIGSAIGIDNSSIQGSGALNNVIQGVGTLTFRMPAASPSSPTRLQPEAELTAIGIRDTEITTGAGDDIVVGHARLNSTAGFNPADTDIDIAGFRNSQVYTGLGDDLVSGNVTLPGLGSGLSLERSLGFRGFDSSQVHTGLGNDRIEGNAYYSELSGGLGGDTFNLDHAWGTRLMGGLDNDLIRAFGQTHELVLDGGLGSDGLEGGDGNDLVMGGLGIDAAKGGAGSDTFVYSGAGALEGTASSAVNAALLDSSWGNRSFEEQVGLLQQTERVLDFQSGSSGDVLLLSSALGSVAGASWDSRGQVLNAQSAEALRYTRLPSVVVDTLANIQTLGIGSPRYAVAMDRGLLLYDADGDYSRGTQVVAALGGDLSNLNKGNFRFG
jgi:Ca2+-binding RTX toxin-like protein